MVDELVSASVVARVSAVGSIQWSVLPQPNVIYIISTRIDSLTHTFQKLYPLPLPNRRVC